MFDRRETQTAGFDRGGWGWRLALWVAVGLVGSSHAQAQPAAAAVDPARLEGIEWRAIGPWRGGRVTAVAGVPGRTREYFMGAAGGGVWHTDSAGIAWRNVSDEDFGVGTIGAIAVAPSDRNVVYVGTGEAPIRGVTTSHGDGLYRSTDGGRSWSHVGLAATRQIADIVVHPSDPDVLYVAAQGNPWGASAQRGVYRSRDGGDTWEQVLSVNPDTGATDLSMDPQNPRVLFAAMWHHRRNPWYVRSGGDGGGIYRSTDGGDTWTRLEGGLPGLIGKVGVAVSPANSRRVYAIVEAEEGGLYRSDDGGDQWTRLNGERLIQARAWYYNHIAADPQDENTVYVLNVRMFKSIDGGHTFSGLSGPHGDHHDLWINPDDPRNMINANDGGATVTFDAGSTWSTLNNQPTAQFYRVSTDDRFPFWIYGGQQDNTTVAIASQTLDGGIGAEDFHPVGGGESAHVAFNPADPRHVYATTINATLTEYDMATRSLRPIKPYPEYVFGRDVREHRYRTNWNAPVAVSPHDPHVLYYGTHKLLRSADRGVSWEEISPDLTRDDESKQGRGGGPITNEQAGAEFYNTIFYVLESVHRKGELWVGSDDGLVHRSRDGGKTWRNLTPSGAPEAHVNAIEISPHNADRIYLAMTAYKLDDFSAYIYESRDGGEHWRRIDGGLPPETFVRVVREDPKRAGLLYAGTEAGMFFSPDSGAHWQSLRLNLPPVPITDLKIRHDRLVAATQGRGFWILDDLSTMRATLLPLRTPVHAYTPAQAIMLARGGGRRSAHEGKNPADGAVLYYHLSPPSEGDGEEELAITIEIEEAASGRVVRHYSSAGLADDECVKGNEDPRSPVSIDNPSASPGLNRWVWDFAEDRLNCVEDVRLFAGWAGPRVAPGEYRAVFTYAGEQVSVPISVRPDPRLPYDVEGHAARSAALRQTVTLMNSLLGTLDRARHVREALTDARGRLDGLGQSGATLTRLADEAIVRLDAWEQTVTQPLHKTFEDDINWPNMIDVQVRHLIDAIDSAGTPVTVGAKRRLSDLEQVWAGRIDALAAIHDEYLAPFNSGMRERGEPYVEAVLQP
ncbi:MAG: glycosyl hydrolase [Pseudomonadota bacterium]